MKVTSQSACWLKRGAQLLALAGLAISSPLLNILQDGPEFFVNRRVFPFDIISLTAILLFALPLLILTFELVASLFGSKVVSLVHALCVALLATLALTPLLASHLSLSGEVAVAAAAVLGIVIAVCVTRIAAVGTWLAFLSVLALFSAATFLASEGVSTLLFPRKAVEENGFTKSSDTPVVVLIFDEFPLNGLLTKQLEIDSVRFPHFAALANDSVWFKNAAAVNQFTPIALPAILSGKMPRSLKQLPTAESYPANLFTILSRSHAISAYEPFTRLCPDDICRRKTRRTSWRGRTKVMLKDLAAVYLNYVVPADLDVGVPDIDGKWGDFWSESNADWDAPNFSREGRVESFRRFVRALKPAGEKPPFVFIHVILPHMPHQFTPAGRMYSPGVLQSYVKDRWTEDPDLRRIGLQQFMMQLGATDRILGELVGQLKEIGIYEKALFVAVADHGMSFQSHTHRRGHLEHPAFYEDVMSIPLFVKLPNSSKKGVSARHAQTVDVVPTILDVLGLDYKLSLDGVSLFGADSTDRAEQTLLVGRMTKTSVETDDSRIKHAKEGEIVGFPVPAEMPRATIDWKYSFPGFENPSKHNPFFIGPHSELLGRQVSEFQTSPGDGSFELMVRSRKPDPNRKGGIVRFEQNSRVCPCNLQGAVRGGGLRVRDEIAVAINGTLQSFTNLLPGAPGSFLFGALVTESAFTPGANKVELFKVESVPGGSIKLQSIKAQ